MSPSKVKRIQEQLDQEREALKVTMSHKNCPSSCQNATEMAAEEKKNVEKQLQARQAALERQREERTQLQHQLSQVQSKLVVGGVDLLEKAKEQEEMLEQAQIELEQNQKVFDRPL